MFALEPFPVVLNQHMKCVIAGLSRRPRLLRHSTVTIEVGRDKPAMTALGSVST